MFNEAISTVFIDFLKVPDRFGRDGVSILLVGNGVVCFNGNIFKFACEASSARHFKVTFKLFCFVKVI